MGFLPVPQRDHMDRMGIVHLDCWSIKVLSGLGLLYHLIFIRVATIQELSFSMTFP